MFQVLYCQHFIIKKSKYQWLEIILFLISMNQRSMFDLYKLAFYNGKQGQAAAVSVIGFLILLFCASLYMVSVLKKGDE